MCFWKVACGTADSSLILTAVKLGRQNKTDTTGDIPPPLFICFHVFSSSFCFFNLFPCFYPPPFSLCIHIFCQADLHLSPFFLFLFLFTSSFSYFASGPSSLPNLGYHIPAFFSFSCEKEESYLWSLSVQKWWSEILDRSDHLDDAVASCGLVWVRSAFVWLNSGPSAVSLGQGRWSIRTAQGMMGKGLPPESDKYQDKIFRVNSEEALLTDASSVS